MSDYRQLDEELKMHQASQFEHEAAPPPPYNPSYGFIAPPQSPAAQNHQVINVVTQYGQGPAAYGLNSMQIQCPSCMQQIKTRVSRKSVCKTHGWACCLFLFLCWPCVCVPYCCASCKDAYHSCPNCRTDLGVYRT